MWCEIYNLSVDAVHELGKTGLAVGSLVLVDNMLGGSHVETLGDGLEGSLGLLGVALVILEIQGELETADWTCLVSVLSSDLTALLRMRAASLVRIRFF